MSIANQKGGVGKSTLSSLFAYFLADKKSAWVLAVDLDSQRNLSHTLRQCGIDIPTTALFADARIELPAVDASHTAVARRCHGIPVRTLSRSGSSRAVR